jgi:hypothetical protein
MLLTWKVHRPLVENSRLFCYQIGLLPNDVSVDSTLCLQRKLGINFSEHQNRRDQLLVHFRENPDFVKDSELNINAPGKSGKYIKYINTSPWSTSRP